MNDTADAKIPRRTFLKATCVLAGASRFGSSQALTPSLPGAAEGGGDGPAYLSLSEVSDLIHRRKLSPVELTQSCLRRIEALNPRLNAFITITADAALQRAKELELELQQGRWRGPLHGVPVGLKDLFDTQGVRTTAASAVYRNRVPSEDAEVVRRLKTAGAILLGKLNMDEFAFSFTSETSHFGPVRNPWKLSHTPGGSSGGSAAAVAAGLCYAALGSDTGGSVRQPAAFCNIIGLKPSYGLISTHGVLPLAGSLDHVGPMTRTVRDTALVLQSIAGRDPKNPGSARMEVPDFDKALARDTKRWRCGIARTFFFNDLHPEVASAVDAALKVLESLTQGQREVRLPDTDDTPVLMAEAYAWHEPLLAKSRAQYHPRTVYWLERGGEITMPQYVRARQKMERLRREAESVFENVDFVVTPTVAQPAIPLKEGREPDIVLLRNAIPFNLLDLPTVTVPAGFTSEGLPVGLQISGSRGNDAQVLALAHAFEQATGWYQRHPPVA
ncbi:MAG: amidase [Verrucomicrobiia bacterium]